MTPEEFRVAGHALIDWIAQYRSTIESRPVMASTAPGSIRAALGGDPPVGGSSIEEFLADLDRVVVPNLTQVQHPSHFGWFPSNASLASVIGDIATAGIGSLGITWQSAPALTDVEEACCDWMRQLCGLSDEWLGTIHDTASTAVLVAMLCARERASGDSQSTGGLQTMPRALVVYATSQGHSSIPKSVLLAGFGRDNLRFVATDPVTYAMDPHALSREMAADVAAGRIPAAVIASVGTTGTTAIDPIRALIDVAKRYGAWVHVDAALAGSAMLLPEMRHHFDGVDGADSLSWNPHKWMGTILDCSLYYTRDAQQLIRVMSTNPSYLKSAVDGEVTQYKDWGIPLGRRFRALKLWSHLRFDGIEAIRTRLRRDLENARWLEAEVRATPDWRVLAPVPLQTVCIRHEPAGMTGDALDQHTLAWVDRVNASGEAFLSASVLDGQWMARVSIGVEGTERRHVAAVWDLIQRQAAGTFAP
jgi:aromatic-L-amino-acid/L-tryptophan decarboxylase